MAVLFVTDVYYSYVIKGGAQASDTFEIVTHESVREKCLYVH